MSSLARNIVSPGLSHRGLFLYAWDVWEGPEKIADWMQHSGLNTMCLAANYHSGWFVHPHSRGRKLFMTEGSVCYFPPKASYFRKTRLKPRGSKHCAGNDWLKRAAQSALRRQMRLVAWAIGVHNTRLGMDFPELTQQNVYGDRLPHALCPSQPEVQTYLIGLCRNLAEVYFPWGIQPEAFGWMSFRHGHHHERDLAGLTDFEAQLLSLCFCPACVKQASKAGVPVADVKTVVKATLDGVFREAPDRPRGHPRTMREMQERFPEVAQFNDWREKAVTSLWKMIQTEALDGTGCRLLLQSGFDERAAEHVAGFACSAYGNTAAETYGICRSLFRAAGEWKGLLQCFVQLGMGMPRSARELHDIIRSVRTSGCNGISFYNYSEAPPKMLRWLSDVLKKYIS